MPVDRTPEQISQEMKSERAELADAAADLRVSIDDTRAKVKAVKRKLPFIVVGTTAAAFVVSSGLGSDVPAVRRPSPEAGDRAVAARALVDSRGRRLGAYSRSSAPKRSPSSDTIAPRSRRASSSVSVRTGDWNDTENATDFFPAGIGSPV